MEAEIPPQATTTSRKDGLRDLLPTMLWFAMLGPPIGLLGALVEGSFYAGPSLLLVAPFSMSTVYVVVGPPALATGFLVHFARLALGRSSSATLVAAAVIGATVSWLWFGLFGELGGVALVTIVGGATALILAGFMARWGVNLGASSEPRPEARQAPEAWRAIIWIAFGVAVVASATWVVTEGGF